MADVEILGVWVDDQPVVDPDHVPLWADVVLAVVLLSLLTFQLYGFVLS